MSEEITTEVEGTEIQEEQTQETSTEENTPTLESLQAELEKVRTSLEKAKQEKERLIRKNKEMQSSQPETEAPDTSEIVKPWKKTVAVAELRAAGLDADQAKRLLPMLDLSSVDVSDEGISGLSDQIEGLKKDFPQLFTSERKTVRKVETSDKSQKATPPSGLSEATRKMLGLD